MGAKTGALKYKPFLLVTRNKIMNLKMCIMSPLNVVFVRDSSNSDTYDPRASVFDTLGMKLKFQIVFLSLEHELQTANHTHTKMNTDCGC